MKHHREAPVLCVFPSSRENSNSVFAGAGLEDLDSVLEELIVKPALAYLDVIKLFKDNFELPIAAYNVSGEYAMVKASGKLGWLDANQIMIEMLTSIKRAGADIILSYFAKEFALLQK